MSSAPSVPEWSSSPRRQALVFQWLRWRMLCNTMQLLWDQSGLRMLMVVLCSVLIWGFVFAVSFAGFKFLHHQHLSPFGSLIGTLFDLMFMALGLMLSISSGLILYSSLFTTSEAAFLLSTAVHADQIFGFKYQGSVAFSSWAFLLLGSPVLIAYGIIFAAPWYFYVLLPLFFIGFVLVPGALGSLVCLLLVNYLPRQRKQAFVAVVLVLITLASIWLYELYRTSRRTMLWDRDVVQRLLDRFGFTQATFVPSHWMTKGLQAAGQGYLFETPNRDPGTLFYLGLLWSTGLVLYVAAAWLATRIYRCGYNRVSTGGSLQRRYSGAWADRLFGYTIAFFDAQTRLLIIKDFRTFRRDAAQWVQVLIFTGLMVLYLTNIRRLFLGNIGWGYRNGISLLNLTAIALLLCTYTGRFIYPLLSLEGRKFWILGLLPLQRSRLLWGKFTFSAIGVLFIAEFLVLLSDLMLEMPWQAVTLHTVTVAVLSIGLSGLSVGLGACLPNFQDNDPSKIASGFGGTVNLVVGLSFLLFTVCLLALPWHLVWAFFIDKPEKNIPAVHTGLLLQILGIVLGLAAVVFPLRAGVRTLEKMEF